jgi:hypothetical protein
MHADARFLIVPGTLALRNSSQSQFAVSPSSFFFL